jgi:hypothetical protein
VPPSFGIAGLVSAARASIADADPVQNREPQSGVVVPRTGSPTVAAIAALGNSADDPTATTGMLCALLAGTHNPTIASASSALQIFHRVINILLFSIELLFRSLAPAELRLPRNEPLPSGLMPWCSPRS